MKRHILRILAVAIMGALITGCAAMKLENNLPQFSPQTFSSDMYKQNVDNFIVIIDSSFSMVQSHKEQFRLTLGKAIIDRMSQTIPENLTLKTGLISYGYSQKVKNAVKLFHGLTDYSKDSFKAALDKITPTMGGDLKLSNAITMATDILIKAPGKSAIIIVTDGKGNDSALTDAARLAEKKMDNPVAIYSILVGDPSESVQWVKTFSETGVEGFAVNADYILSEHKMADFVKKVFMLRSPDTDGDGVDDPKDQCPNTAAGEEVNADGCIADNDHDGVYDSFDKCPGTQAKVKIDAAGCPMDYDQDGVSYLNDQCPKTPTNVLVDKRGCPTDNDKDGVYDYQDSCIETPEGIKVDERGCPFDTDKDGVYDYQDSCIGTPEGVKVDGRGCPFDTDNDGVYDYRDICLDTPEGMKVDPRGCILDADDDGIFDYQDACLNTPLGMKVNDHGCLLDTDSDGVYDPNDDCLKTPLGIKVTPRGCPLDIDGDGIYDYRDSCLGTPAGMKVDGRGCVLDSDNDGVYDPKDICLGTPMGVKVDSRGCPFDNDNDGVYDYEDSCPATPAKAWNVDEQGCWIAQKIFFDYKKNDIKDASALTLNNMARVLNSHPWVSIELWAHTDSIGSPEYNLNLAQQRGNAAKNYLLSLGIESRRVGVFAEGLNFPSYENKTKEGRAFNRRVEIKIVR